MEALSLIGDLGLNVVDEKEIARCKDMFTLYDEDKDGKLTYAELLTCVRCCGRNPSVDEFKEMVQVIDTKLVRLPPDATMESCLSDSAAFADPPDPPNHLPPCDTTGRRLGL